MPEKSSADFAGARLAMLLLNLAPLVHIAAVAGCLLLPLSWPARAGCAAAALYLLPLVPARLLRESLRRAPPRIPMGSADFLKWWAAFQCQVIFLRFPALEEVLRSVPGLYSLWLRLWGSRVGRLTYWAPRTIILDRGFLDIGDHVVFGAGTRLNPHVIERGGDPRLLLAPVRIGDGAMIGGYSLLTAGTDIAAGETTRAFFISPPFSKWQNGRRNRSPS
jgi:hypothetical protein